MSLTVNFPLKLNSAGIFEMTDSIDAKLDFLFTMIRSQRLGDKDFGLPALFLEQITDGELEEEKSLYIFQIQQMFYKYINNAQLISVDIVKTDKIIEISIVYQPLGSKKEEQFKWRVDLISKLQV